MPVDEVSKNGMACWFLESDNCVRARGHLWLAHGRFCINPRCLDRAEASRTTGSPGQEDVSPRAADSDFINESARAMVDAMQHKFEDPNRLTPAYALISRIRLSSPTNVVESAERVAKIVLTTYSEPNLTAGGNSVRSRRTR